MISRYGTIGSITVTNGNIGSLAGDNAVSAVSIGSISVTNGNVLAPVTTTNGSLGTMTVTNGTLENTVTVTRGDVTTLGFTGGLTGAGRIELTDGNLGTMTVSGGSLAGDVDVDEGNLTSLTVRGGDIDSHVNVAGNIGSVTYSGTLNGGEILAGGTMGTVSGNSMNDGTVISAGAGISQATFSGNVAGGSSIESGYGTIGSLTVSGTFNGSTIAVGVSTPCTVADATGNDGASMNGTYTPNGTVLNGMPVYGSGTYTIQYVAVAGGYQWELYSGATAEYTWRTQYCSCVEFRDDRRGRRGLHRLAQCFGAAGPGHLQYHEFADPRLRGPRRQHDPCQRIGRSLVPEQQARGPAGLGRGSAVADACPPRRARRSAPPRPERTPP